MATPQIDKPTESVEELLEKANRAALEKKEISPAKAQFIPQTLTDDELRSLAIEKLSHALQAIDPLTQPEMTRKLCAEVKDRLDGKPGQQMTIDQNLNVVTVNAQISFVKALPLIDAKVIDNEK